MYEVYSARLDCIAVDIRAIYPIPKEAWMSIAFGLFIEVPLTHGKGTSISGRKYLTQTTRPLEPF
jgi:hypothetical protein